MDKSGSDYSSAEWLSFRQALDLGGNVRKGEHGTPIFFYVVAGMGREVVNGLAKSLLVGSEASVSKW
jgi:hypothetical protein